MFFTSTRSVAKWRRRPSPPANRRDLRVWQVSVLTVQESTSPEVRGYVSSALLVSLGCALWRPTYTRLFCIQYEGL